MRWPWVSRSMLERREREYADLWRERCAYDGLCEKAEDANDRLTDEVRRLTDIIVEMKREGFHPAPPPDAMPSPEPDLPSQITEAIMARSTRKSDLERELYRYAIRAYDGKNAEDVAGTIWHGGDPQEDE